MRIKTDTSRNQYVLLETAFTQFCLWIKAVLK